MLVRGLHLLRRRLHVQKMQHCVRNIAAFKEEGEKTGIWFSPLFLGWGTIHYNGVVGVLRAQLPAPPEGPARLRKGLQRTAADGHRSC